MFKQFLVKILKQLLKFFNEKYFTKRVLSSFLSKLFSQLFFASFRFKNCVCFKKKLFILFSSNFFPSIAPGRPDYRGPGLSLILSVYWTRLTERWWSGDGDGRRDWFAHLVAEPHFVRYQLETKERHMIKCFEHVIDML